MFKFTSIFILALINLSLCCPGCIELDEISFEKIIKKFKTALVKFDQSFPYGERHETFSAFSQQINNKTLSESDHDDILIATVGIKDYGDLENKKLADRYHVKTDAFPVLKLFIEGDLDNPIDFNIGSDDPFTINQLFSFLKKHSKTHILAPGCHQKLDELSDEFMLSAATKRKEILKQAEKVVEEVKCDEKKQVLKFYLALMRGVLEKGVEFIGNQNERINKLLKDKISKKKQEELNKKLNIISSFKVASTSAKNEL